MSSRKHPVLSAIKVGGISIIIALVLLAVIGPPLTSRTHIHARRAVDGSNLRQIGMASLIYAADHHDRLPTTADLHTFMVELAKGGGLNDASLWISMQDPALDEDMRYSTVLNADRTALHDELKDVPVAWAVVISGLSTSAGSHTPVAWTRGLQPDGTWSKENPYQGEGGYIVFLGGNITPFIRDLKDFPLQRHDGNGTTTNILEALPPGARIGEWRPPAR